MTKDPKKQPICATCCKPVVVVPIQGYGWRKFNADGTEHSCGDAAKETR